MLKIPVAFYIRRQPSQNKLSVFLHDLNGEPRKSTDIAEYQVVVGKSVISTLHTHVSFLLYTPCIYLKPIAFMCLLCMVKRLFLGNCSTYLKDMLLEGRTS